MGGLQRAGAGVVCLLAVVLVLRVQERERLTDERDLAQVRYESGLLEKQLAFAQLEATESRARHERDMRQAAIEAAAELSAQSRAAVEAVEAPAAEAPAAAAAAVKAPAAAKAPEPGPRAPSETIQNGSAPHLLPYLRDPSSRAPRRRIKVVVYNKIAGYLDWLRQDFVSAAQHKCSTECIFTNNRRQMGDAQGILFHAKTHSAGDFPGSKPRNAKYMLVSLEQERYAPLLKNPGYVRKFDYVMTYDLDSTLPMISIHPHWDAAHYFDPQKGLPFEKRDDAVAAFVSNCKNAGAEQRLKLLLRLNKTYPVHSYGKCLHNIDEPKLAKGENRGDAKRKLLARYKFALAFENAVVKDYVSEKVYDAILAGALPLYRGADRVDKLMPGESAVLKFVDFGDDVEKLAAKLRVLAKDKAEYETYFAWRRPPRDTPEARANFQKTLDMTAYKFTALCRVCARLAADLPR